MKLSKTQLKLVNGLESSIGTQSVENDNGIRYFKYQGSIICMVNDTLKAFKTYENGYNKKYSKDLGEKYANYFLELGYTREQDLDD